jgi:hypothetical protein
LSVAVVDRDSGKKCGSYRAASNYLVSIEHRIPPSPRWLWTALGTLGCLAGVVLWYCALFLFASHDITPPALVGLVLADLIGFVFVWCGLGMFA